MRNDGLESLAVQHFRKLCGQRSLRDIRGEFSQWLAGSGLPEKTVGRSMLRFVDGHARTLSANIAVHFISFCRDALHLEVSDDEFDIQGSNRDYLGEFCQANHVWRSVLDELSHEYILMRPRQYMGDVVADRGSDYNRWKLIIRREGDGGRHVFVADISEKKIEGNVICDGDHLILIGIEDNLSSAMFMILAPFKGNHGTGILIGSQLMRVIYDDKDHHHHQVAVARATVAVRTGRGQSEREAEARSWLDAQIRNVATPKELGAGFVVHLHALGYTPRNEG